MTDSECAAITTACLRLAAEHPRTVSKAKGERWNLDLKEYFCGALLPALTREFPPAAGWVSDQVAAVALMAYLADDGAGAAPAALRHELFAHVAALPVPMTAADRLDWIVQLGLAYGCGWHRRVKSGVARWDGLWVKAMGEMAAVALVSVRGAYKRLVAEVRDFPPPEESTRNCSKRTRCSLPCALLMTHPAPMRRPTGNTNPSTAGIRSGAICTAG